MHLSFARTLTSLVLALALLWGGALHGAMASDMASPMDGPAVSQLDGDDGCQHCGSTGDAISGSDCAVLCLSHVGVIATATLPAGLEGRIGPLQPSAVMSGIAAPPEPSPPKHHLG
jgi:hypothetical protein